METQKKNVTSRIASKTATPGRARILVVDDHPIFRQGMADLLNRQKDVLCCGEAATVHEIQHAIEQQRPDLVLLDLRLGTADGLEAIKTLKAQFAGLQILILSQFDEMVYAERVLRAGACGYVMKEQATEEVMRAIRTVLNGDLYVSPKVSMMAVAQVLTNKKSSHDSNHAALSDRELHVFKALGNGRTNKEIASNLNLSVKTIETYREHIKYKLGFSTGSELVRAAQSAVESDGISSTQPDA